MSKKFTVALAGNPNCGKTTLFNALTGAKQRVGNWPGVTVERLEGTCKHGNSEYSVIDLPGIYSFSAYSLDEKIAREFILQKKPDLVINIVDASNMERNLYLTTQLIEMKVPVLVALNMMDLAKSSGVKIEVEHLMMHLDCPVIPIVANRGKGIEELCSAIDQAASVRRISSARVEYDEVVEKAITALCEKTAPFAAKNEVDARWMAIKLLEYDELAEQMTEETLKDLVSVETEHIRHHTGEEADIVVADGRYGFIHGLSYDVVNRTAELSKNFTDTVDKIVLNRILGIPIFMLMMYLMFVITMNVGGPFIDFFDKLCGTIFVGGFKELLTSCGITSSFLITLLADGVGGAIQMVSTFIPPIGLIFLCLSALEDSGYMARAAFVMDRFLRGIGLPGKAFIPMLVGLGCNVPGIMATRTLENNRDRLLSVLINPLISCGARLPVYTLFIAVFFRERGAQVLFAIYFTGIVLAVLSGLLFSRTILKGETSTFVMELPPYHIPTVRGVLFHAWERLKAFMFRAGRVLAVVFIAITFLSSLGTDLKFGHEGSGSSLISFIGKKMTPVFYSMGLRENNWPATVGLFTGIFAKEAVIGTMSSLYAEMDREAGTGSSTGEADKEFDFAGGIKSAFMAIPEGFSGFLGSLGDPVGLREAAKAGEDIEGTAKSLDVESNMFVAMQKRFVNKASVFAYLLFILIYAPCAAAISAIYRETNLKWTIFAVSYLTLLAWIVSTLFYQVTRLVHSPGPASVWIALCLVLLGGIVLSLQLYGARQKRIKQRE